MKTSQIVIQCEGGLHLRVAARLAQKAQKCQSAVHMRCEGCPWANACSIMELLKLGVEQGKSLEVTVEGADEEVALRELTGVLDEVSGM